MYGYNLLKILANSKVTQDTVYYIKWNFKEGRKHGCHASKCQNDLERIKTKCFGLKTLPTGELVSIAKVLRQYNHVHHNAFPQLFKPVTGNSRTINQMNTNYRTVLSTLKYKTALCKSYLSFHTYRFLFPFLFNHITEHLST